MDFLMKRDDIQPVILGGDMSTYSLAREFYEAFGVASVVIGMDAISVIKKSRFVRMHIVPDNGRDSIEAAIREIAARDAGKKVIVIANTDDRVELVENIQDALPDNVVCPLPPHDLMSEVSDKVRFQQLCGSYGLDVPKTQVVSLAGEQPIAPAPIAFPLIAKPAASSEYNHYIAQGFQKIYFMHEQAELDHLWAALREAGFAGEFLVQELIEGDDTYMDSLTVYMNRAGEPLLLSGAHVLLEDHAPTLFGNPVAMIDHAHARAVGEGRGAAARHRLVRLCQHRHQTRPQDGPQALPRPQPARGRKLVLLCGGGRQPHVRARP